VFLTLAVRRVAIPRFSVSEYRREELIGSDPEWLQHFELLVRSVLVRPEMPAIIILGHFSPQIQAAHGFAGPELLHNVAAQFYDVPHIRYVYSVFSSIPPPSS
jgi:hypothetical protein